MNKVIDLYPELCEEFDQKVNTIKLADLSKGSHKKVWWKCKKGHKWQAEICNRVSGTGCPFCAGNCISKSNSLKHNFPMLAKEFDMKKNAMSDIHAHSNKKVWWVCYKNSTHQWQASPNDRVKSQGCPFCSGRRASASNNFAIAYPELMKQWYIEKNKGVDPYGVTPSSGRRVWWKCSKALDHEWFASVNQRVTRQKTCPFCSGRKLAESNRLSNFYPDLVEEWDNDKNDILPSEVTCAGHKKVWWKCSKGHSWLAVIHSRTINGNGCPSCKISRGEQKVAECLDAMSIKYVREHRVKEINNKRFDFAIFRSGQLWLIEYHGAQHYIPFSFGSSVSPKDSLALTQKRDKIKRDWATSQGHPLLEISYKDFSRVDTIVKKFLL